MGQGDQRPRSVPQTSINWPIFFPLENWTASVVLNDYIHVTLLEIKHDKYTYALVNTHTEIAASREAKLEESQKFTDLKFTEKNQ